MNHYLAQGLIIQISPPPGTIHPPSSSQGLEYYLSIIIGVLTLLAFVYFIFQLILSGYMFLSSEGDKGKVEIARNRMSQGVIGLIVIVASIFLVGTLGKILGLNNILSIDSVLKSAGL